MENPSTNNEAARLINREYRLLHPSSIWKHLVEADFVRESPEAKQCFETAFSDRMNQDRDIVGGSVGNCVACALDTFLTLKGKYQSGKWV